MAHLTKLFVLILCTSTTAYAQSWKWDVGVGGRYSLFTPFLGQAETGLSGGGGAEVLWRAGSAVGLQVGRNFDERIALRLNATYSDRPVTGSDMGSIDFVSSTNIWSGTVDLLFRLKRSSVNYRSGEFTPFVGVGAGVRWLNPGYDGFTCRDSAETHACVPIVTGGSGTPTSRGWAVREHVSPQAMLAVGGDVRVAPRIMLRAEISDHVFRPGVYRAQHVSGNEWSLPDNTNQAAWVHQFGAGISVHFLIGVPAQVVATIGQPAKAAGPPNGREACPAFTVTAGELLATAPLRASVVGTATTARQKLQTVLEGIPIRYAQSDAGHIITDWSVPYPHPDHPGYQRRHAFTFEFVPVLGGTDVLARWIVCSSVGNANEWFVLQGDKLSQPEEVNGILEAVRRR
jgi:hypothetical protein